MHPNAYPVKTSVVKSDNVFSRSLPLTLTTTNFRIGFLGNERAAQQATQAPWNKRSSAWTNNRYGQRRRIASELWTL